MGDFVKTDSNDRTIEVYVPDKCPEFGTPEHYALGGGRGPIYEPVRWMEDIIKRRGEQGARISQRLS